MDEQFCLRWNDYQTNLSNVFSDLLFNETFVDVTLACDGASLKCHKIILSACSPFFQEILMNNPCKHPVIILKDISFAELRTIVDFMYKGQVNVSQDDLSSLIRIAEMLKIKGLAEMDQSEHSKNEIYSRPEFPSKLGRNSSNSKRSTSQQNKRQKRHQSSTFTGIKTHIVNDFQPTAEVVIHPLPLQQFVDPAVSADEQSVVTSIKEQPPSSPELDNKEFGVEMTEQELNDENPNPQPGCLQQNMNDQKNSTAVHEIEPPILPGISSHSPENSQDLSMLESNISNASHESENGLTNLAFVDSSVTLDTEQNSTWSDPTEVKLQALPAS